MPTPRTLLVAYAIIEGSKVVNAENVEKAAEGFAQRTDKFLNILELKLSEDNITNNEDEETVSTSTTTEMEKN